MRNAMVATALCASGILAVGVTAPLRAQTPPSMKADPAATVKAPETSQEHLAMAETYRNKAATYRSEAATHRQMLDTYKKQVAVPTDQKVALENPWIKKMRLHRDSYIRGAEKLALEADAFAEFHTMRSHETQGK